MSLAAIDLNLLLVLDTVLSERSVAAAARRLHVTPSAISNALARLRAALGDPLLARSGRGLVPTPRAAALAPALARALRDLDRAVHGDRFDPATSTRTFTMAIADAGQLSYLPGLACRFAAAFPRARLRVVGIDTLLASGGLAGTEVDVLVGAAPDPGPQVHRVPVFDERTVLVARRRHPTLGARAGRAALAKLRYIDVQIAPGTSSAALAAAYRSHSLERDIALVVPTFTAAAAVAAATDLVAHLPYSLVTMLGPRLGLRTIATPLPAIVTKLQLMWHERTHHDPAIRAFRALIEPSVA